MYYLGYIYTKKIKLIFSSEIQIQQGILFYLAPYLGVYFSENKAWLCIYYTSKSFGHWGCFLHASPL